MVERREITPKEAEEKTLVRINQALSDYEKYLETGEYPPQPSSFIIHLSEKNIHFDSTERILSLNNNEIQLSPHESRVLTALLQAPKKTQDFRSLYQQIHKEDDPNWMDKLKLSYITENLRPLIFNIRNKLGLIHPELQYCIVSKRYMGYFWDGGVTKGFSP